MRGIFSTWSSESSLLFLYEAVYWDFLVYIFLTSNRFEHILICFGHYACSQSCLDLFPVFLLLLLFLCFSLPPFLFFIFLGGEQGLLVQADLENFALIPQMLQIQVLPLYWILWNTGDEIQGFIHARQTLSQPISEAFPSDYLFFCLFVSCRPDCHQIKCSHSFSLPVSIVDVYHHAQP